MDIGESLILLELALGFKLWILQKIELFLLQINFEGTKNVCILHSENYLICNFVIYYNTLQINCYNFKLIIVLQMLQKSVNI